MASDKHRSPLEFDVWFDAFYVSTFPLYAHSDVVHFLDA